MGFDNVNVNVSGPMQPTSTYKTRVLKGNHSFASQVTETNTKYVIKHDFDLGGESVTIPEGCLLEFDGGSLSEGTVIGNNTSISAQPRIVIFDNIDIQGTWNVTDIYVEWMKINASECRTQVASILKLQNDNIQQNIYFPSFDIAFTPVQTDDLSDRRLIELSSNTKVFIPNKISVNRNNLPHYEVIYAYGNKNINICGGGTVTGDVGNHEYEEGSTSEWGFGISFTKVKNALISEITIEKCIGDGIYLGGGNESSSGLFSKACENITLENVRSLYNRRQGLTVIHAKNLVIKNSEFSFTGYIESTSPSAGIDFEPNDDTQGFDNVLIDNCIFIDNLKTDIKFVSRYWNKNITIRNSQIGIRTQVENGYNVYSTAQGIQFKGVFENIDVDNCLVSGIKNSTDYAESESIITFNNCEVHMITHFTDTNDRSPQKYVFNNCRIGATKKKVLTIGALIYIRCRQEIELNNCVIDWSDCIDDDGNPINNYFVKSKGVYRGCFIKRPISLIVDAYNCVFEESCSVSASKGETIYFINNTFKNNNEGLCLVINKTAEFIDNGDTLNTKIVYQNNNFSFGTNPPIKAFYNDKDVDVEFIGYVPDNISLITNPSYLRSITQKIISDNSHVDKIRAEIVDTLNLNSQASWYKIGYMPSAIGKLKCAAIGATYLIEFELSFENGTYICEVINTYDSNNSAIVNEIKVIDNYVYFHKKSANNILFIRISEVNKNIKQGYIEYVCDRDADLPSGTQTNVPFIRHKGPTTIRPTLSSDISDFQYFDTTLGKPIWWNGTAWVDATGTTV